MKPCRGSLGLLLLLSVLVFADEPPAIADDAGQKEPIYLEQGWNDDERIQFYYTTQGSQLIPYDWFLALEQPKSDKLFRDPANMDRLRFLAGPKDAMRNPDELPIGFVKDDNPETVALSIKASFLGKEFPDERGNITNAWLGLTCAACHTSQLEYQRHVVRIDGGPAMADVQTFLRELSEALGATHQTEAKFDRFAKKVLADTGDNPEERKALCKRVAAFSKVLQQLVKRTQGNHPYGFARLDAFGSILNEVCETSLEQAENHFPADAPASFPFLWDTPQLDWVQWNGSIDSPIARNVGEVLGVFGQLRLKPDPAASQFTSTAHVQNLFELEQLIDQLAAPKWPRQVFGAIDWVDATAGERLYAENCGLCHAVRNAEGKFPLTAANALGAQFIETKMIPLEKIGTDPQLARNFTDRVAVAGFLKPLLPPELQAAPKIPRRVLLSVAVAKVVERKIKESQPPLEKEQLVRLNGFRMPGEKPPNLAAYKARPLNGVWATAPYLHNGSVPHLDALLRPAKDRPQSFWVGSRSLDVDRVGFVSEKTEGASHFQVVDGAGKPVPGNSNAGHEGKYYTQRRLANGTWREFTGEERQELIEYMKTLR